VHMRSCFASPISIHTGLLMVLCSHLRLSVCRRPWFGSSKRLRRRGCVSGKWECLGLNLGGCVHTRRQDDGIAHCLVLPLRRGFTALSLLLIVSLHHWSHLLLVVDMAMVPPLSFAVVQGDGSSQVGIIPVRVRPAFVRWE